MSRESTGRLSLSSSPAPGQITVSGEIVADLIADMHSPGDFRFHVGGHGANVALALARLGMSSTLLMPMSRDALGERFAAILSEAGVRLPLASASDLPTSIALVSLREGQPVYSLYREGVADRDLHRDRILSALPVDPAVHVIGAFCYAVEPDRPFWLEIAQASRQRGALLSSDPNIRRGVMENAGEQPRPMLQALRQADIVKASDEDLAWLFPGLDPHQAALRLFDDSRVELVALTLGEQGSVLRTRSREVRVPARPARPFADAVGAGDTYHAALLSGLLRLGATTTAHLAALDRADLTTLASTASVAASLACEHSGCQPPTADEVAAAG